MKSSWLGADNRIIKIDCSGAINFAPHDVICVVANAPNSTPNGIAPTSMGKVSRAPDKNSVDRESVIPEGEFAQ